MKIKNIEVIDGVYHVTKSPNFIQRLFGIKDSVERYKTNGQVFYYFSDILVFYKSDGSIVSPLDDMCQVLNNYVRAF